MAARGLAHPFLILILEGAPLLSRLLRQGGDFDLRVEDAKSSSPPCPCKERRDKDGAAAGFEILFGKDGPAPVKGKAHCAIGLAPTLAQRTRRDGEPGVLVRRAEGETASEQPARCRRYAALIGVAITRSGFLRLLSCGAVL